MNKFLESLCIPELIPSFRPPRVDASCKIGIDAFAEFTVETRLFKASHQKYDEYFRVQFTPYGKFRGVLIKDFDNYSGINAKCITPIGEYLCELSTKTILESRVGTEGPPPFLLRHESTEDNCVGFIYNLLRMYCAATMKHIKYEPTERFFQGENVHVTNQQFFGTDFKHGYAWTPAVKVVPTEPFSFKDRGEVWLHWNGSLTEREALIVSAAASAWTCESPIGVLHLSPALTEQSIRLVGSLGEMVETVQCDKPLELASLCADEVRCIIWRLIASNRLEGQFDMALAMVAQIYISHKPSNVEGFIWCHAIKDVNIPMLRSFRGWNPCLIKGEAYSLQADEEYAFRQWTSRPMQIFWRAAVLSEAAYYEMQKIVGALDFFYHARTILEKRGILRYGDCLTADLMLAAGRAGKEVSFPRTGAGLNRFAACLWHRVGLVLPITVESAASPVLRPRKTFAQDTSGVEYPHTSQFILCDYAPFVLPILSAAANSAEDALHADNLTAELEVGELWIYTNLCADLNRFMTVFRMMGLDAIGTEDNSGEMFLNRSDTGWFIHYPSSKARTIFSIDISSIANDGNTFKSLPNFEGFAKVTAKISNKLVSFESEGHKQRVVSCARLLSGKGKAVPEMCMSLELCDSTWRCRT